MLVVVIDALRGTKRGAMMVEFSKTNQRKLGGQVARDYQLYQLASLVDSPGPRLVVGGGDLDVRFRSWYTKCANALAAQPGSCSEKDWEAGDYLPGTLRPAEPEPSGL